MNQRLFVLLFLFCVFATVAPNPAMGELIGSINAEQKIVLSGNGESVVAMDFFSEAGLLIPIDAGPPSPWGVLLSNSTDRVAFGSFQDQVIIDGEVVTKVGYTGTNPVSELEVIWTDPTATAFSMTVLNPAPTAPLSGFVNALGKIVLRGSGQEVVALNFQSPKGLLIPIADDADSVFEISAINSPTNVAIANFGTSVTVDGELVTAVGYRGADPENELAAEWGDLSTVLHDFEVSRPDVAPLSGYVNAQGKIVLQGSGQQVVALEFQSPNGLLIPVDESDNDAIFQFAVSNEPTNVAIGNFGTSVTVDGELVTDVGYRGLQPENELIARWGDLSTVLHDFQVTRPTISLDCNGNGVVDNGDLSCGCSSGASINDLLSSLNLIPGDLDANGEVAFIDFLILANHFSERGDYSDGDIDCNGTVEFLDFLQLASNFGKSSAAAAAVPEPNGTSLLVAGLFSVLLLRRKLRAA